MVRGTGKGRRNYWVTAIILLICLVAIVFPFFFSHEGPYGGHDQNWYRDHPQETAKELAWCNANPKRDQLGSCIYARNGQIAGMMG
ncbi:MAG: hypothetical protein K0041_07970 [Acidithiobacillus sp.]|nr:hypothetical protein [Acidithiobacillus sp.]